MLDNVLIENINNILNGSVYRLEKDNDISYSFWKKNNEFVWEKIFFLSEEYLNVRKLREIMNDDFSNLYKEKKLNFLLNKVVSRKERINRILKEIC